MARETSIDVVGQGKRRGKKKAAHVSPNSDGTVDSTNAGVSQADSVVRPTQLKPERKVPKKPTSVAGRVKKHGMKRRDKVTEGKHNDDTRGCAGSEDDGDADEECPGMLLTDFMERPGLTAASVLPKSKKRIKSSAKANAIDKPFTVDETRSRKAPSHPHDGDLSGDDPFGNDTKDSGDEVAQNRLLSAVMRLDESQESSRVLSERLRPVAPAESEFHAGAVDEELTVEDLLEPLSTGASGLNEARRQLQNLAQTAPLPEPVSDVKRSREERVVQYASTSRDVSKWIPQVQRIRRADQVVLGDQDKDDNLVKSTQGIVGTFKPVDDFEQELNEIVAASGTGEDDMKGARALPMNDKIRDVQQTCQVRKLKALMLREQQASKRVGKIKSKTYRRIHRKAEVRDREALLERLEIDNPELAKALKQEYEKKHAEMRMMRQRNARKKWASAMQRFAKGDKEAQKEISKQATVKRDEQKALRRAVQGKTVDQSSDSEAVDLSGSDSDGDGEEGIRKQTISKAKKLAIGELRGLEEGGDLPTTGIMGMGFMRDAIKRKREAATQEAKQVLQELEGLDRKLDDHRALDSGDEADSDANAEKRDREKNIDVARTASAVAKSDDAKTRTFTAEELEEAHKQVDAILERDDMATECSVSGPLTVHGVPAVREGTGQVRSRSVASAEVAETETASSSQKKTSPSSKLVARNPWLQETSNTARMEAASSGQGTSTKRHHAPKEKAGKRRKANLLHGLEPSSVIAESVDNDGGDEQARDHSDPSGQVAASAEEVLSVLQEECEEAREQRDLVRTAFVQGTQEEDFVTDVKEEKREKDEKNAQPDKLPGWGCWTDKDSKKPKKRRGEGKGKPTQENKREVSRVQFHEGLQAASGKYFVDKVPFPFQNPDQYNQEMRMPSGPEWNTFDTHLQRIKPKVCLRAGSVVPPLQYVRHLAPENRDGVMKAWAAGRAPKRLKARF
eukprot:TRINITY_DN2379_c0_g1_i1.p1 TRINITY_DN2379_c0_g1~~TRINITY_DN2379_c0_g1_i1.p1  ORF type:complete len:965 (-),score=208.42 TRINITY_DN2379_c0_g1_i1:386-3280(-)